MLGFLQNSSNGIKAPLNFSVKNNIDYLEKVFTTEINHKERTHELTFEICEIHVFFLIRNWFIRNEYYTGRKIKKL